MSSTAAATRGWFLSDTKMTQYSLLFLPENVLNQIYTRLSPKPHTLYHILISEFDEFLPPAAALALTHPYLYAFYYRTYVTRLSLDRSLIVGKRDLNKVLSKFLQRLPCLNSLAIMSFSVARDATFTFPAKPAARVRTLEVSGCDISPKALCALLAAFPQLRGLSLAQIAQLPNEDGQEAGETNDRLAETVGNTFNLKHLEINYEARPIRSISGILALKKDLKVLKLNLGAVLVPRSEERPDLTVIGELEALHVLKLREVSLSSRYSGDCAGIEVSRETGHFTDSVAQKTFEGLERFGKLEVLHLLDCGYLSRAPTWQIPSSVMELSVDGLGRYPKSNEEPLRLLARKSCCLGRLHSLKRLRVNGEWDWLDTNLFSPALANSLEVLSLAISPHESRSTPGLGLTGQKLTEMGNLRHLVIWGDWIDDSVATAALYLPCLTTFWLGASWGSKVTAKFQQELHQKLKSGSLPYGQKIRLPLWLANSAKKEIRIESFKAKQYEVSFW